MREKLASGGAVTTALAYTMCWQLPLLLASFGLGSFTMSMWFNRYRWIFLVATIVLLGFAYYQTFKNKKSCTTWSRRILHSTTVFSLGLIVYTLINTQ